MDRKFSFNKSIFKFVPYHKIFFIFIFSRDTFNITRATNESFE